ncbi:RNA binding protein [Schizosaccharomyces japonicus yFS275]|uniref:RNA binding protein n=1 Tax=Schizosaccharomyces japonicus (strain yFS275 / FY16936) TaxID=402676 RepID=B6K2R8_SCHJY|nr:RNA binding protein [Schizosaccharomyces japonicus yFS275]EEB07449.1 RNA binding protein [Schizosaccharomyces japonicus yFS275]
MTDYKAHKVTELRDMLSKRGLSTSGNKAELIERLKKADTDAGNPAAKPTVSTTASDLGDLAPPEDDIDWGDNDADDALGTEPMAAKDATTDATEVSNSVTESLEFQAPETASNGGLTKEQVSKSSSIPSVAETESKENATAATTAATADAQKSISQMSEAERRLARAKRFGVSLGDEKVKRSLREARFGGNGNKQKNNGARFPKNNGRDNKNRSQKQQNRNDKNDKAAANKKRKPSILDDPVELEKAKRRAERFGLNKAKATEGQTTTTTTTDTTSL